MRDTVCGMRRTRGLIIVALALWVIGCVAYVYVTRRPGWIVEHLPDGSARYCYRVWTGKTCGQPMAPAEAELWMRTLRAAETCADLEALPSLPRR
jgi:hypothetical protein